MSKFKVGDKVKRVSWFDVFPHDINGTFIVPDIDDVGVINESITLNGRVGRWFSSNFELASDSWTIYNNTKPLSELSDEQRGLLFNHNFNGGEILDFGTSEWVRCRYPTWDRNMVYRAKQKSERELFIDAANKAVTDTGFMSPQYAGNYIEALFNAGFKAPKVGE